MQIRISVLAALAITLVAMGHVANAGILFDDHFDNGDAATGGINGGLSAVSNGVGSTVLSESGSILTVTVTDTGPGKPNGGGVSLSSFALGGSGTSVTFVVDSVSKDPDANGQFLGIVDDGSSFYRSIDNIGFVFFGREDRTASGNGFSFMLRDIGNSPAGNIFSANDVQLSSYLDGFTAAFTLTLTGWSYEVTGLNDTGGTPTTFTDSNTWIGSGEAADFYSVYFDDAEHVAVSGQSAGATPLNHAYDRITVVSLPEPSTFLLAVIGALGLVIYRGWRFSGREGVTT